MPLIRASQHKLVEAASDAEPPEIWRALAQAGDSEALAARLASEADPQAREAALTRLARIGGSAVVTALLRLSGHEDLALRNAVIETLQCMGSEVIDGVEALLADPDPNVRIYALTILEKIEHPRAAAVALRAALNDPHVNVCAAAIEVVGASGSPEHAAPLRMAPHRFPDHPFLGFAVRAALKQIG